MINRPLVILESPYAANDTHTVEEHTAYARECLKDSLMRGEAPIASHLLYTQVLDDTVPEERMHGIDSGLTWGLVADETVVYIDLGISSGMQYGIKNAYEADRTVEFRTLLPTRKYTNNDN